jgi:hypothetical protein
MRTNPEWTKVLRTLDAVAEDLIDSPQLLKRFRTIRRQQNILQFTALHMAKAESGDNHPLVKAYAVKKLLEDGLVGLVPVFSVQLSTSLGGYDRPFLSISLSLDPKEKWANGIFQNSRHGIFDVSFPENQIEGLTSRGLPVKFRKTRFDTAAEAAQKFLAYIAKLTPPSVER